MADNTVTYNVNITDNGSTEKVSGSVKGLNTLLKDTEVSASRTSKALASATGPKISYAKATSDTAMAGSQDLLDNRAARGIEGVAGSASKNFSRMSQGLGGLVHVYATFAANLFAVSAAFTALSKAADVTNMIKGLDQLGASSGRALGSLAKSMTLVADGAISMKEAMQATAQASAGGMTGDQILRMTEVAKKASQALGRDMGDALSRLSRGITKIEPELLDELGIMTKVDKAAQDYARSLGKTAASLSDFERRQAFATAALAEGEQKFNSINLDANPYQKLLASISNLSLAGAELINKVLGPIVKLLSESPGALTAVMAGIATILITKAIPALTMWREGLNKAAIEAAQKASSINQSFDDFKINEKMKPSNRLESIARGHDMMAKALISEGTLFSESSKIYKVSLDEKIALNETHLNTVKSTLGKVEVEIARHNAFIENAGSKTEIKQYQADQKILLHKRELLRSIEHDIRQSLAKRIEAEEEYLKAEQIVNNKRSVLWFQFKAREELEKRAKIKESKVFAVAGVAEDAQVMGFSSAMEKLKKNVYEGTPVLEKFKNEFGETETRVVRTTVALKGMAATTTMLKGAFIAASTELGILLSLLQPILIAVGLAIAAFEIFDGVLEKNTKEREQFGTSLDILKSSVEGLSRTFDLINSKDIINRTTIQNIQSAATSVNELSTALDKTIIDLKKAHSAASEWDKFKDFFSKIWGGDLRSKATVGISSALSEAIKSSTSGPAKDQFIKEISELLNVDPKNLTLSNIKDALNNIPLENFTAKLDRLGEIQSRFSLETNNNAANLTAFSEALKVTHKALQDLGNSYLPTDHQSKFAIAEIDQATKLQKVVHDSKGYIVALSEVVQDFNKLSLFPPEVAQSLLAQKDHILKLKTEYADADTEVARLKGTLLELKEAFPTAHGDNRSLIILREQEVKKAIDYLEKGKVDAEAKLQEFMVRNNDLISKSYSAGIERLSKALELSSAQAAINIQKAAAGAVPGEVTAKLQAELIQQEIGIRQQQLEAEKALVIETRRLSLIYEKRGLEEKVGKGEKIKEGSIQSIDSQLELIDQMSKKGFDKSIITKFKEASNEVRSGLNSLYSQYIGFGQKAAALVGEAGTSRINSAIAMHSAELKSLNEKLEIEKQSIDIQISAVSKIQKESEVYSQYLNSIELGLLKKKEELAVQSLINEQVKIAKDAQKAIKELKDNPAAQKKIQEQLTINLIQNQLQIDALRTKSLVDMHTKELENLDQRLKFEEKIASLRDKLNNAKLDFTQAQINTRKSEGTIAPQVALEWQKTIELEKQNIAYNAQVRAIDNNIQKQMQSLTLTEKEIEASAVLARSKVYSDNSKSELEKQAEISAINQRELDSLSAIATARQDIIDKKNFELGITQELNNLTKEGINLTINSLKRIEDQNKAMKNMQSIASSLSSVFGKPGKAVGDMGVAYQKMMLQNKKISDTVYASEEKKQQEQVKNYLEGTGEMVSAFKGMFDEKSKGYQVLSAIEKTIHIARMAMLIVEMIMGKQATASQIQDDQIRNASTLSTLPAEGASAILNQGKGDPYSAFVRMAIMGGVVAAILAAVGGSSIGSISGATTPQEATSEYNQKIQGTGTVLGDSAAKSETISKGIEVLAAHSWDMLDYSKDMLTHLRNIDKSMGLLADFTLKTSGIVSGPSPFGTLNQTTVSKDGGFFGLFASTTTTQQQITDTGLVLGKLGDTVQTFIDGLASISQYETVATTVTESGGGLFDFIFGGDNGSSTSISSNIKELSGDIPKQIGTIFLNMADSIKEGIKLIGLAGTDEELTSLMSSALNTPIEDFKLSLKDLKGDDLKNAISSYFSSIFDKTIDKMLPYMEHFQKSGEGLGETFIRLASQAKDVNFAFKTIGLEFPTVKSIATATGGILKDGTKNLEAIYTAQSRFGKAQAAYNKAQQTELDRFILTTRPKKIVESGLGMWARDDTSAITEVEREAAKSSQAWQSYWSKLTETGSATLEVTKFRRFGDMTSTYLEKVSISSNDAMLSTLELADANSELAIANASVGTSTQDYAFRLAKLTQHLVDGSGGLDAFIDKMDFFSQNFYTEAERVKVITKQLSTSLSDISDDAGNGLPGFRKQIIDLNKQFPSLNVRIPTTRDGFRDLFETISNSLVYTGEAGADLISTLLDLAPAFDQVAKASEDIANTVADVVKKAEDLKFNMEYETKDQAGKYAMLDLKASKIYDDLMAKNEDNTYKLDIYQAASSANELLDQLSTAFGLLSDEQKQAALPAYQQKINEIEQYITTRGIDTLTTMSADGVGTVQAISDSASQIVSAILSLDATLSTNLTLDSIIKASTTSVVDSNMYNILSEMASTTLEKATNASADARVAEAEKARLAAENKAEQNENTLKQLQSNSNNAINGLANGTTSLTQVAQALGNLISQLASVAKQPANISVTVTAPEGAQVGIA